MPTYHPAALLRDESKKRDAWEDLQSLAEKYKEIRNAGKGK
jgi:DNA polymerase